MVQLIKHRNVFKGGIVMSLKSWFKEEDKDIFSSNGASNEYYNIKPEEAFGYLCDLAELTDDAIVNAPDEIQEESERKTPVYKGKYHIEDEELFYFKNDVVDARMKVVGGKKYIVLEGSKIDPNLYSSAGLIEAKRLEKSNFLSDDGVMVIKDIEFSSPSLAASFVRGGASNGKYYWRSGDNRPLNDFIVYDK